MEAFCDGNNRYDRYDLVFVVYGREGRNDWCVIWKGAIDGRMEDLVGFSGHGIKTGLGFRREEENRWEGDRVVGACIDRWKGGSERTTYGLRH